MPKEDTRKARPVFTPWFLTFHPMVIAAISARCLVTCLEGCPLSIRPLSDLLPSRRHEVSRGRLAAAVVLWCVGILVCGLVIAATLASAAEAHVISAPPDNARLQEVISNLRNVIVGLLVALATLFATIGGVRYLLAGGDPGEAEAGKRTLRNAAIGYGIAALAPILVQILKYIVES